MNTTLADSRQWFILALVLAGGWLLYLLAPVLTPFLMSALLGPISATPWLTVLSASARAARSAC